MERKEIKTVASAAAPAAIGPYSQGIAAGRFVFSSGELPIDPANGSIPIDVRDQTRQALANVQAVLQAAGCGLDRVIKTTVFLIDMADFAAVNEAYKEVFAAAGGVFPARSAVQVAALPKPDARLEIEAIASL